MLLGRLEPVVSTGMAVIGFKSPPVFALFLPEVELLPGGYRVVDGGFLPPGDALDFDLLE